LNGKRRVVKGTLGHSKAEKNKMPKMQKMVRNAKNQPVIEQSNSNQYSTLEILLGLKKSFVSLIVLCAHR
jgi:hypothetical protein